MKEYRIKLTVKNNLLLTAIENAGYTSQTDFANACAVQKTAVNELVAMRKAPITSKGVFSDAAKIIMEVLGACPTDLWSEEQLTLSLKRNSVEYKLYKDAISAVLSHESLGELIEFKTPETELEKKELKQAVIDKIETLGNKEKKVLYMRNGFDVDDAKTLEEIATSMDLCKGRIGQIEDKAIRKMRHPSRSDDLLLAWKGKKFNE